MRHAMANCFEALMGALFLDAGLRVADRVFSLALWYNEPDLLEVWTKERLHPLQEQEPLGDRKYIKDFEFLQKLTEFEDSIAVSLYWNNEPDLLEVWTKERLHPLQEQEPLGDRKYIKDFELLQKLTEFEDSIAVFLYWNNEPDLLEVWTKERLHPLQEQEPLGDRKYIKDFEFLQKLTEFEDSIDLLEVWTKERLHPLQEQEPLGDRKYIKDFEFLQKLTEFEDSIDLLEVWTKERLHPLQEQEPLGDRKYIKDFEFLQKLTEFEDSIGVQFKHIRLLARAFTDRSVGFTHLTLGSNQRLEFLGDTVLQLVVSDRLYRHFPDHHEGHLSLLRSSLVNNRTQSMVCDDLNMSAYAIYNNPKAKPTTKKHKADLLEAFLGALYVDKNLEYCQAFCNACLFPRLQEFIMNQDWNDPKSKLQQCCLTLRSMEGGEPDIPLYKRSSWLKNKKGFCNACLFPRLQEFIMNQDWNDPKSKLQQCCLTLRSMEGGEPDIPLYKVIECLGPTNTRVYTVGVYFRGTRLAAARGHSIQEAEMNAAEEALHTAHELFPQLDHQKRVIAKSMKKKKPRGDGGADRNKHRALEDRVPKAYRLDNQQPDSSDESSHSHPPSDDEIRSPAPYKSDDSGLDSDDNESVNQDKKDLENVQVSSLLSDMEKLKEDLIRRNEYEKLKEKCKSDSDDD
ncbi:ribonuclease III domain-containing protein [Phthorimaea operculella]|nr:ribonuclease III domain-containing protein [Phthorimaea operculella]